MRHLLAQRTERNAFSVPLRFQSNAEKSGLRFSKNAVNASFASGASSSAPKRSFSALMAAMVASLRGWRIRALVVRTDAAGSAIKRAACFWANGRSSPALSTFDIIYTTTKGGPGTTTLVPGISIFRLAFVQSQVGLASAFGIVLLVCGLLVVLPIQRLSTDRD